MKQEIMLMVLCVAVGSGFCFIYDFFRILRGAIKHSYAAVSGEDLFYWFFAGIGAFGFFLFFNDGKYRFYMFLAMLLGAAVYRLTLGRLIVKPVSIFLKKILEIAARILKKIKLWFKIKKGLKIGSKTRGGNIEKR